MAQKKNHWIIPPAGDHAITVSGLEAGEKVTPASEAKIHLSATEFGALGFGAAAKCESVYKCTTVGPFKCPTVTISQCFNLIDCTGVTCTDLTTKI
jgi:hypothetical protein